MLSKVITDSKQRLNWVEFTVMAYVALVQRGF